MRLIDADATIKYLRGYRCKDCDRRKGMRNGEIQFCYEIGDAPCRACDIGDAIDYFLEEDISPTVDAVPVVRCKDCEWWGADRLCENSDSPCFQNGCTHGNWFCADGEERNEP